MFTEIDLPDGANLLLEKPNVISGKLPAIIFFHGFASNKDEVNGFFKYLSNKLADENCARIRVDLPGFGKSKVALKNIDLDILITAAKSVIDYVSNLEYIDKNNIIICAFSLGCSVAVLASSKQQNTIQKFIFISPTAELRNDFSNVIEIETIERAEKNPDKSTYTVPVWSHGDLINIELSGSFFKSLSKHKPLEAIKDYKNSLHIICGDRDFSCKNANNYINNAIYANKNLSIYPGEDHIFHAFDSNQQAFDKLKKETFSSIKEALLTT